MEGFELREGYACFRPAGPVTARSLVVLLKEAMHLCRDAQATKLLANLTMLTHPTVTTVDRFEFADGIAQFWDREIHLAMVLRPDQIDPERFGVMVARYRGLHTTVHTSETEALEHLLGPENR